MASGAWACQPNWRQPLVAIHVIEQDRIQAASAAATSATEENEITAGSANFENLHAVKAEVKMVRVQAPFAANQRASPQLLFALAKH